MGALLSLTKGKIIDYFVKLVSLLTCIRSQPGESTRDYSDIINKRTNDLIEIVDARSDLINELHFRGVLNNGDLEELAAMTTNLKKVAYILNIVSKMTIDKQELFFSALDATRQSHVSNFIRTNGIRLADDDVWPLIKGDAEIRMWDGKRIEFVKRVDARNGLIDELFAAESITHLQKEAIQAQKVDSSMNESFFMIFRRRSVRDFWNLIKCLEETKQHQVARLLTSDQDPDEASAYERRVSRLTTNYAELVKIIDLNSGLLTQMLAARCITYRQKEYIESADTKSQGVERLLDAMRRVSQSDFDEFLDCLRRSGQEHVCCILLKDGVLTCTEAKTGNSDAVKDCEEDIIRLLRQELRNSSEDRRKRLCRQVSRLLEPHSPDVTLVDARIGNSVDLFFFCSSYDALQHLRELFANGELESVVTDAFEALLRSCRADDVEFRVETLFWDPANYEHCVRYFLESMSMNILSDVYRLERNRSTVASADRGTGSLLISQLPLELVEMMLLKTAGQLFVAISRQVPRADIYAVVTVSAVERLWWRMLIYRDYNKRLLRRYFNRKCQPYVRIPRLVASLTCCDGGSVTGIAEVNGTVYVSCSGSDRIKAYSNSAPYGFIEEVKVHGLKDASDIAVCRTNNWLYVGDCELYSIWRVNLCDKQAKMHVQLSVIPWSLSVTEGRLLVTTRDGTALYQYNEDASERCLIKLNPLLRAFHAVETNRDTFLICHCNSLIKDTRSKFNSITEITADGQPVGYFERPSHAVSTMQLNRPQYLICDADDEVIVADRFNERLVVIGSDLHFKRMLVTTKDRQPIRTCLCEESGLLFVAYFYSNVMGVYKVKGV